MKGTHGNGVTVGRLLKLWFFAMVENVGVAWASGRTLSISVRFYDGVFQWF